MAEGFVPLAVLVRRASETEQTSRADAVPAVAPQTLPSVVADAGTAVARELALVRTAACEALEAAAARVLRALAEDVLARELALAPADIARLVDAARERVKALEPLCVAVSAHDAPHVRADVPLRVDPSLAAGDVIVDVRDGALEAHLRLRFEAALDAA